MKIKHYSDSSTRCEKDGEWVELQYDSQSQSMYEPKTGTTFMFARPMKNDCGEWYKQLYHDKYENLCTLNIHDHNLLDILAEIALDKNS